MSFIQKSYDWIVEKFNPAQSTIANGGGGGKTTSESTVDYRKAFDTIESVNRGVSMIVNAASSLDYDVKSKISEGVVSNVREKALHKALNFKPNPYQSAIDFRKNIFTDLVIEGNAFCYFDGTFIYHLPANQVEILTDEKTFIKGYKYNGTVTFGPNEVFSFKDIAGDSIYRGSSRLKAAKKSIAAITSMTQFQQDFFDNGAVFGLILTTDNTLSQVAKDKTINHWVQRYSPKAGGRRPLILDSGLKPHSVAQTTFKDMDFDIAIKTHGEKILQALGVPPILLAGGNNANITPNLRLFYLETVLPIVRSYTSALERFFGYDVDAIISNVSALQPELKDIAAYHTSLVNGGILTPNEARIELRYEKDADPESDKLRVPANIAGSAADPSQGGKPPKDSNSKEL